MSTPIKPPGSPPTSGANGENGAERGRVEGRSGELRALVDQEAGTDGPRAAQATELSTLERVERDVVAGRISVDQAIDRLVARALEQAAPLPADQRAMIEANLRNALAEDPTLIALRKELERGSSS